MLRLVTRARGGSRRGLGRMANDVFGIVGRTLAGAFRVDAVVAEGGFAVVYRAYHSVFRAPVALKCLKIPERLSADAQEKFQRQFLAEAELLFKLSASLPTVVRPLHVDAVRTPEGRFMPFVALEWLEGETLAELALRRAREGMPPPRLEHLVQLLDPVARALERAHDFRGPAGPVCIVHRDMKPENIFIAEVGGEQVVKVLDFGIAKAKSVASHVSGQGNRGEQMSSFTPAYGAPEQWAPNRFGQTGPWTDVWGLALTMVELLAGRPIIDGDSTAMMGATLDPVRRPTPRNEGVAVSAEVEAVFCRALAVEPRRRQQDVATFWHELLCAVNVDRNALGPDPFSNFAGAAGAGCPTGFAGAVGCPTSSRIPEIVAKSHRVMAPNSRRLPSAEAPSRPRRGGALRASGWPFDLQADPGQSARRAATANETGQSARRAATANETHSAPRPPSAAMAQEGALAPEVDVEDGERPRAWSGTRPIGADSVFERAVDNRQHEPLAPRAKLSESATGAAAFEAQDDAVAPPPSRSAVHSHVDGVGRQLVVPGALIAAGVLITVAAALYAASSGDVLQWGPIRPVWLAAVLVLSGIGLIVRRLLSDDLE